jgi:hypothetical protein
MRTGAKKKSKKTQSGINKKLLYAILLLTPMSLALIFGYYLLVVPGSGNAFGAAIVDQLGVDENLTNSAFIDGCTSIINASGFDVEYYKGEVVNIEFYSDLPSKSGKILILRAHSSIRLGSDSVDVFTSERFQQELADEEYLGLVVNGHISKAIFDAQPSPDNEYFAIGPSFVSDVMRERFSDSLVVLMGCAGLNQTSMAEALVDKGARVVIGWTKNITLDDTDSSTLQLLELLLAENPWTVDAAIDKINNQVHSHNSKLEYYPKDNETAIYKIPKAESLSLKIDGIFSILYFINIATWRCDERSSPCLRSAGRYSFIQFSFRFARKGFPKSY